MVFIGITFYFVASYTPTSGVGSWGVYIVGSSLIIVEIMCFFYLLMAIWSKCILRRPQVEAI